MLAEGTGHLTYGQRQHLFYDQPRPFSNHLLSSIKVFDGLFMANYHAGREEEFLFNNKIGLIINCSPHQFSINKSSFLHVLSYNFLKKNGQLQQSLNIVLIMEIIVAIEYFLNEKYEGVIIISKNIGSKVLTLLVVYLMIKFNWNLDEALMFVSHKKEEIKIGEKYIRLLQRFLKNKDKNKLSEVFFTIHTGQDEQLLKNTVMNAQTKNLPNFFGLNHLKNHQVDSNTSVCPRKVKFQDKVQYIGNGKALWQSRISKSPLKFQNILERSFNSEIGPKKLETNLNFVEKKLKKYIREKNLHEQISDERISKHKKDEKQQIIIIKNKQIIRRLPRRRAKSKTQESIQNTLKESEQIKVKNNNFLSKFINIQDNERSPERQTSLINQQQLEQKASRLSQTKKIKVKTRFYTEQAGNDSMLNEEITMKREQAKGVASNIFKISKSNKSSYKKIKSANYENKIKTHSSKTSDKCINYFSNQLQKTMQKTMKKTSNEQKGITSALKLQEGQPKCSNININFHLSETSIVNDSYDEEFNIKEQIRDKFARKFNMKRCPKKGSHDETR